MSSGKLLAIGILFCFCASIGGCTSAVPAGSQANASYAPTPTPADIPGSNAALQKAGNAMEKSNKTAFMETIYPYYSNISGSVLSFDFSGPKAAALARGIKSAKVTGSEAQVWRYLHEYKDGNLVLLGDSIYDRVDYETTVDGETYAIITIKEGYTGWTIARMYSASDTFIETDGAKSWLDFYR